MKLSILFLTLLAISSSMLGMEEGNGNNNNSEYQRKLTQDRQIRAEQDVAFQASLRADEQKEKDRQRAARMAQRKIKDDPSQRPVDKKELRKLHVRRFDKNSNSNSNNNNDNAVNPGKEEMEEPDLGQFNPLSNELIEEIFNFVLHCDDLAQVKQNLKSLNLVCRSFNQLRNNPSFMNKLVENIAQEEDISPIQAAFKYNVASVVAGYLEHDKKCKKNEGKNKKIITAKKFGMDPLTYAALHNSIGVARLLLGKDPKLAHIAQASKEEIHIFLLKKAQTFIKSLGDNIEKRATVTGPLEPNEFTMQKTFDLDASIIIEDNIKKNPNYVDTPQGHLTPLYWACWSNSINIIRLLLKHNVNTNHEDHRPPNRRPPLETLIKMRRKKVLPIVKLLAQHHACYGEALLSAVDQKSEQLIRALLPANCDPDIYGNIYCDALHNAVEEGLKDVVRVLIEIGHRDAHKDSFDRALEVAACHGRMEVAKLLLENGANAHKVLIFNFARDSRMKELLEQYEKLQQNK